MGREVRRHSKKEIVGLLDPLIAKWFTGRFEDFTEPQSYAVPLIHQRKDVLVSSPTGSGKTLTAFTSIINELFKYSRDGGLEDKVYAIYVSPLKALANDIERNLNEPLREIRAVAEAEGVAPPEIRVGVRTGDTSQSERQKMLRKPPHILITTPESLALVLAAPKFREKLMGAEYVVVDEIHEVCDSKRGVMLSLTLERLQAMCQRRFTRIGLSATLAPMEEVAAYLSGHENGEPRDVAIVEIMRQRDLDVQVVCPTDDMTALPFEVVNCRMYDTLFEMVSQHRTTIVFTNTRSGTEHVVFHLKERGLEDVEAHHGSLAKETRLDVEERLKQGRLKCVVTSTSLELGIDIGSVDLVVQIGSPKSVAKGLQRIGRSGHGHGLTSKGRMLVFEKDDLVECAVLCRAAHRKHIDRVAISENCLDVLAQSLVGMSLEKRWGIDEALELVRRSHCYRNLTEQAFMETLRYLSGRDAFEGVYPKLWYDEEEKVFGKKAGSRMIYFMNLGTIPDEASYKVFTERGGMLGDLSEKFVERLGPRDVFVLGGRSYEFVRAKGMRVFVREAAGRKPTVPSWSGEMLPRSFDLSMGVAEFRRELRDRLRDDEAGTLKWLKGFGIDGGSARSILSYFEEQKGSCDLVPCDQELAVEGYIDMSGAHSLVFHFPFGRRVNDALSRAYAFVMTQKLGCNISVSVTDDAFMLTSPKPIEPEGAWKVLRSADLEGVLSRAIRGSELFKQRFRHTASRSFMILRNYKGKQVPVGRQQVRSSYLLEALEGMDGVPVMDETYREIMEDVMDVHNAVGVLEAIEEGRMKVTAIPYSATPSPFAHAVVLAGIGDMVLMEDRGALLRELHRKVLAKVMGSEVSEFEMSEERVVPYFRARIGAASSKEELLELIGRAGPLRVLKEKGRSVYPYTQADRASVDEWSRQLLEAGLISSVYIDDAYFVAAEELPMYVAALSRERSLNDLDRAVLSHLNEPRQPAEIAKLVGAASDKVHASLRKLEASGSVGRKAYSNGKWSYASREVPPVDRQQAIDHVLLRYLECFAPATADEISFALGLDVSEASAALAALVQEGAVAEGRFLVSESAQFMLSRDRLRLRTDDMDAFDHATVSSYRRSKQDGPFRTIEELFSKFGTLGSPLDAFHRVSAFSMDRWEEMRRSGRVLLGRFLHGQVRYVMADDAPMYVAAYRNSDETPLDRRVLEAIRGAEEGMPLREVQAAMGPAVARESVKESVDRLDRSMRIVRRFEDREDWGSENWYEAYDAPKYDGDPYRALVERFLRAHGPLPAHAISSALHLPLNDVLSLLSEVGAVSISVGEGREEMHIAADEIDALRSAQRTESPARIVSLQDPSVQALWASVAARYGDRWVHPIVSDGRLIGGVEKWNMSGCVEVRDLDLESLDRLPEALAALDRFMEFQSLSGYDVVRIREALGSAPQDSPPEVREVMESCGYMLMGDMFVKGRMVSDRFSQDELISYALWKQRIPTERKSANVVEAARLFGSLRSDNAAALRCRNRIPLRKAFEMGFLHRIKGLSGHMTYSDPDFSSLCRSVRDAELTNDMRTVEQVIAAGRPMSKEQLLNRSPLGPKATAEALKEMTDASMARIDQNRRVRLVPPLDVDAREARKEAVRRCFHNFGVFTAETLARCTRYMLPMRDLRSLLSELVDEGFLVKGFLSTEDDSMRWVLKEDLKRIKGMQCRERFVLALDDDLHVYLAEDIRREMGRTAFWCVMDGPRFATFFRAQTKGSELTVFNWEGDGPSKSALRRHLKSLGMTLALQAVDEIPEWEVQEFYEKTHPGE